MLLYNLSIYLYSFAVALVSPFHKKARMTREGQKKAYSILREKIDKDFKYIWFHAASLGEFEQGRPMIEKIKSDYPGYKVLLTFFSPSGYEVRKNYNGADIICYLPFDTPGRVRKFMNLVNPAIAIFIKYEFWYNYLSTLKKRNIPTYIISAIFRKDQIFFKWYGGFYRKVLGCFNHLYVQDEASKALLEEYGVDNVTVAGDTRFDRVLDIQSQARILDVVESFAGKDNKGKILVAGSSWPQDEEIFVDYFNEHPEMKLIIAPHEIHEEHIKSIIALLKRPYIRMSEATKENVSDKDCLIIDCFGLLSSIYRYGDIAYIGGGFGVGIHNTLEAAVYGIPVIFGPNYTKFKEARDLISVGGAFSVENKSSFKNKIEKLLNNDDLLNKSGHEAGHYVKNNAGGTERILRDLSL
jgi:3-deoxy-D-manno-octulosonic-acid transferase